MKKLKTKISFLLLIALLGIGVFVFYFFQKSCFSDIKKSEERVTEVLKSSLKLTSGKEEEEGRDEEVLKIGWITDIHLGTNTHEEKLPPLADEVIREVFPRFQKEEVDFVMVTGDMVDDYQMEDSQVVGFHKQVKGLIDEYGIETYYTLGNHDVCDVDKETALDIYGMPDNKYVFKKKGWTFIVLDPQFNKNGTSYEDGKCFFRGYIPESQQDWLEEQLEQVEERAVVLSHQPLTKVGEDVEDIEGIYNMEEINKILEESGRVEAVFSGHHQVSKEERFKQVNGIEHFILRSPIFQQTRYSHGIIKIDISSGDIKVERFMDENNEKVIALYEEYKEEYDGKEEEADYRSVSKLKENNPEKFEEIKKDFQSGKDFESFSKEREQELKDFEDYWNYQNI